MLVFAGTLGAPQTMTRPRRGLGDGAVLANVSPDHVAAVFAAA